MGKGYLPRRDAAALAWMRTFADGLVAAPWRYGQCPPVAETIAYVVAEFEAAYRRTSAKGTRTAREVAMKDEARAVAEATCRVTYFQIKHHAGVTDADKIGLGVRPVRRPGGPAIGEPTTAPVLNMVGMTKGSQTLTYADSQDPHRKAKPWGVTVLQLFRAVGDRPETDATRALYCGAFTRSRFGVKLEEKDDGKVATYFARWATAKGKVGPWSKGVSMRIAA